MSSNHGPDRPRTIVVGLYDFTLERPEAPLAIVGPFADAAAAAEYIAHWGPQLRAGISLKVGAIPEPERLPSHMANIGAFRDNGETQCPHKPEGEAWCCLRRVDHEGEHVFHTDRLLEERAA